MEAKKTTQKAKAVKPARNHYDYEKPFIAAVRKMIERSGPDTKAMITLMFRMQNSDSGGSDLAEKIHKQLAAESDAIAFDVLEGKENAAAEVHAGSYGPALLALIAGGDHNWDR